MAVPPAPVAEIGATNIHGEGWWQFDFEQTPELLWPLSLRVFDAMDSQDAQVVSVMEAVRLPVLRARWRINPAGARDEVVQHVATDLGLPIVGKEDVGPPHRTRGRFSWLSHLQDGLLCLRYGHMFFEQVYRIENGRARLRKLAPRMPHSIAKINVATDGGLVSIEQWPAQGIVAMGNPTIPVNRLVAYVNAKEGANWLGRSLLRPAYKNWLIKDRLLRIQAQSMDRNGMGVPVYTGAPGETDLAAGKKLAKSVRAGDTAGAAIPAEAQLRLMGVDGDLPDIDKAIRYHDEQIARRALAHFLTLGGQTGSWALGSSFMDFFVMSLQTIGDMLRTTAQAHVVEDLVDVNYGEGEPCPQLEFEEIGSHQVATAQALKMLVDAGIVFPDRTLEQFLRSTYGLPGKDTPPPAPAPVGG